jgi:thiosulfate/3-mercaptopyruvate sulfurtransferase
MLVSTALLTSHLNDPTWVILDCRHDLVDHGKGAKLYAESHIVGAHFASVETALSGAKNGRNGRHPLPAPDKLAAFFTLHGVNESSRIIAYDDAGGLYAARLWWLARWIGFKQVALLDGGWQKWINEGRPVTMEIPVKRPNVATRSPTVDTSQLWGAGDVLRRINQADSLLIDARAGERFRGEVEPMDPVAGHIPGAVNRFFKTNLNADLTLRPVAELHREFVDLIGARAVEDVGHSCGSGITACANIFAMEYAGLKGSKLYAGSWSEWVSDPARPVARGVSS